MKKIKFSFAFVFAAIVFSSIFIYFWVHPDPTINETYKNILLIITGFVWGSSAASKKKDETISALQGGGDPTIAQNVDTQQVTINKDTSIPQ